MTDITLKEIKEYRNRGCKTCPFYIDSKYDLRCYFDKKFPNRWDPDFIQEKMNEVKDV